MGRRRFRALLLGSLFLVAAGSRAIAQTEPVPLWRDRLLTREPFTAQYLGARQREAADALLKADPFSADAVALLVAAERWREAVELAERIAEARPERFRPATTALYRVSLDFQRPFDEELDERVQRLLDRARKTPIVPLPAEIRESRVNCARCARSPSFGADRTASKRSSRLPMLNSLRANCAPL